MGLGGTKTKVKYGRDPRNTNWSNDRSRFGHKHLERLGWQPGQSLGTGSSGVEGITTHVKVTVKDDYTGLGKASSKARGDDGDTYTGLDSFQRILGRLNGKEEKEINSQLDEQRRRIVLNHPKFGMMFVHGGTLAGSVEALLDTKDSENNGMEVVKSKKRKRDRESEDCGSKKGKSDKKSKEKKKEKKEKEKTPKDGDRVKKDKKEKKGKKEKKNKKEKQKGSNDTNMKTDTSSPQPQPRGRIATRMRYIAQKRAATADQKALNEILMVQA